MKFFKDYQDVFYNFGNEALPTLTQNISRYVDVVDQIKDDISFLLNFPLKPQKKLFLRMAWNLPYYL